MKETKEKWVDVPEYEDSYQVSSFGRVRSKTRIIMRNGKPAVLQGRMMRWKKGDWYRSVSLCRGGKVSPIYLHRLVAEVFIPNPKSLPEVNHKDGVKRNNRADNLEWSTHADNHKHAAVMGLRAKVRLSHNDVRKIKYRLRRGDVQKAIARDFGVSQNCITYIKQGRYFSYL